MSFMLTRIAAPQLGSNVSAGLRMVLGSIVLAIIMRVLKHRWPWQHWRELLLLGFLAVAAPHICYSWSALNLPAGYGALLSSTAVLFGAFASSWLKEETLTRTKVLGCIFGTVGAGLVVHLGPVETTPLMLAAAGACVLGAAFTGIGTPLLKRATQRMEPLAITAGMHLAAVFIMAPGALYELPKAHFTASALAAVTILGVVTSGLAYRMYMRIVQHVAPIASMTANYFSTGFGVMWAVLLLDEPTSLAMGGGGLLIVIACLLVSNLNPLRRQSPSPP